MLLLPAPPPQPPLPDLDDLDDDPLDQPDDEPEQVICLPDESGDQGIDPFRLASRVALKLEAMLDLLRGQRGYWDIEDYHEFARFHLEMTWHRVPPEQQQRIQDYVYHSSGVKALVYGTDAVIEMDEETGDLCITRWPEILERLAPVITKARAEADLRHRNERARQILLTKLPNKRKLKKVRALLDEFLALNLDINEPGRRGIEAVQAVQTDTDLFADCQTFEQYVLRAGQESLRTDTSESQ
jgi:hypothetical protein